MRQLGYKPVSGSGWAKDEGFIFDLFRGSRVHTTELLESPLGEGKSILVAEFSHIYMGVLNYCDLLISKLFRASSVDVQDSLDLIRAKKNEIDISYFINRYRKTASFDISEDKLNKTLEYFLGLLKKEGFGI